MPCDEGIKVDFEPLVQWWREEGSQHKGKVFGSLLGLFFGLMVLAWGFLWAAFIFISTTIGYLVGARLDETEEDLIDLLDRMLMRTLRR